MMACLVGIVTLLYKSIALHILSNDSKGDLGYASSIQKTEQTGQTGQTVTDGIDGNGRERTG